MPDRLAQGLEKDGASNSAIDLSSFSTPTAPPGHSTQKVANKQSKIIAEELPCGLETPPGLRGLELAPPPGFGPPPGFDISRQDTRNSEAQESFVVDSGAESVKNKKAQRNGMPRKTKK
ncbi:unnamed protein product [Gongylonema pulchrum]|uniref:Uncharacterized protein n=1 Tax=Gongylonema pulchrum TaxID=637853 RepID=A0A3P6QTJ1_9BILA|nr:unnamed protein product [Gongylonema pulchrum]